MHDAIVNEEEAAKLMRIGLDCMDGLVANGEIYAASLNQKHCVLLREDVIEFIRERSREQAKQRRANRDALKPAAPETDIDKAQRGRSRRRKPLPALAADVR